MSRNRLAWYGLGLLLALGTCAGARAQVGAPLTDGPPLVSDMQYFRQHDWIDSEDEPGPHQGFWFSAQFLTMIIPAPEARDIGNPGVRTVANIVTNPFPVLSGFRDQTNSFDTSNYESQAHQGGRFIFGYNEGGFGWQVSATHFKGHKQKITATNADVIFDDPQLRGSGFLDLDFDGFDDDLDGDNCFGRDGCDLGTPNDMPPPLFEPPFDGIPDIPFRDDDDRVFLPVVFEEINAFYNIRNFFIFDAARTWRLEGTMFGGYLDLGIGARYVRFEDEYLVEAFGSLITDSRWNTFADNSVFGPEFTARWFNYFWRMRNSVEFRFMPGVNSQSLRQNALIGEFLQGFANEPEGLGPHGVNNHEHVLEFAPVLELKIDSAYAITEYISVTAGFNATYLDGIARSATIVNYDWETMGIDLADNSQPMFLYGAFFGLELNR